MGKVPNRDAIGAEVLLTAGGATQQRLVTPAHSYLSQTELPLTFGLGTATAVEGLRIRWLDGSEQRVQPAGVDRTLIIEQGAQP